jgi:FkbM family methyltransferase
MSSPGPVVNKAEVTPQTLIQSLAALADKLEHDSRIVHFTTDYGKVACFRNDGSFVDALSKGKMWEQEIVERWLRGVLVDADTILDVGGHIGSHCLMFAKLSVKATVHTFEPQTPMFELLKHNVEINGLSERVVARRCAVAHRSGTAQMSKDCVERTRNAVDYGGTVVLNLGGLQLGVGGERVEMICIDDLKLERCDLIKIDVEGCETLVLMGAQRTIKRFKPVIMFEENWKFISDEMCTTLDIAADDPVRLIRPSYLLQSIGYTILKLYGDNFLAQPPEKVTDFKPSAVKMQVPRGLANFTTIPATGKPHLWPRPQFPKSQASQAGQPNLPFRKIGTTSSASKTASTSTFPDTSSKHNLTATSTDPVADKKGNSAPQLSASAASQAFSDPSSGRAGSKSSDQEISSSTAQPSFAMLSSSTTVSGTAPSYEEDGLGDPNGEFNGRISLWRQLEGRVRLLVDVGTGTELTFPDNGRTVQHCFEPFSPHFSALQTFKRPHIHLNKVALGSKAAPVKAFWSHGETMHYRSVLNCRANCPCRGSVAVTTLDLYCDKHPELGSNDIDLLNVSAAGHELEVLRGSTAALRRTKLVLFEYGGTYQDAGVTLDQVVALLQSSGFGCLRVLKPNGLRPVGQIPDDGKLRYFLAAKSQSELDRFTANAAFAPVKTLGGPGSVHGAKFAQAALTIPFEQEHELKLARPGFNLCLMSRTRMNAAAGAVAANAVGAAAGGDASGSVGGATGAGAGAGGVSGFGFLGALRRTRNANGPGFGNHAVASAERRYPETVNIYWLLEMDASFRVQKETEMVETCQRQKHKNFSTGIEDARFVDDSSMFAVTLDTNAAWRSDISFVAFDQKTGQISRVTKIEISGLAEAPQKNWLPLQHWDSEHHLLHSYNPLRIVRVDSRTGEGQVIRETPHVLFNGKAHGGAAVRLSDGRFLVTMREFRHRYYPHSRWMLLDHTYDIIAVSPPFRFQNTYYYEMCMSLSLTNDNPPKLVAPVSLEDKIQKIYVFSLSTILNFIGTM